MLDLLYGPEGDALVMRGKDCDPATEQGNAWIKLGSELRRLIGKDDSRQVAIAAVKARRR
jgi:hypothetical protein